MEGLNDPAIGVEDLMPRRLLGSVLRLTWLYLNHVTQGSPSVKIRFFTTRVVCRHRTPQP